MATLAPRIVPPIRKKALKFVAPVVVATTTLRRPSQVSLMLEEAFHFPCDSHIAQHCPVAREAYESRSSPMIKRECSHQTASDACLYSINHVWPLDDDAKSPNLPSNTRQKVSLLLLAGTMASDRSVVCGWEGRAGR